MSKRGDKEFLCDIREAIHRIQSYTSGLTFDSFLADTKTQDAVIRNLEIIGEATKNISATLREQYPEVPWKSMAGVRDRLVHQYFGVNLDVVWHIAIGELENIALHLERILKDLS